MQLANVEVSVLDDLTTVLTLSGEAKESLAHFLECQAHHLKEPDAPFGHQQASEKQLENCFRELIKEYLGNFGIREITANVYPRNDGLVDIYYYLKKGSYHPLNININCSPEGAEIIRTRIYFLEGSDEILEDILKLHYSLVREPQIQVGYLPRTWAAGTTSSHFSVAPCIYLGRVLDDLSYFSRKINDDAYRWLQNLRQLRSKEGKSSQSIRDLLNKEYSYALLAALGVKFD